jgi:hypothetical protein
VFVYNHSFTFDIADRITAPSTNASLQALRNDPDHACSKFWTDECQVAQAQVRCQRLVRPTFWASLALDQSSRFVRSWPRPGLCSRIPWSMCPFMKSVAMLFCTTPKQRQTRRENQENYRAVASIGKPAAFANLIGWESTVFITSVSSEIWPPGLRRLTLMLR